MRLNLTTIALVSTLALNAMAKDDKEEFYSNSALDECESVIFDSVKHKWTKAEVKKGLLALFAAGYPVNAKSLNGPPDPKAVKVLSQALGYPTRPQRIYFYAAKLFPSFPEALKAAGLPVEQLVLRPNQDGLWTEDVVRLGLATFLKHGIPVGSLELKNNTDPKAAQILSQAVGFKTHPRVLLEKATEIFGTLQNALWSKELVIKVLKAFHNRGDTPNVTFFKYGLGGQDAENFLNQTLGFNSTLYTVIVQARRYFQGDFSKALTAAGLGDKNIFRKKNSQPWTKELVYRGLAALYNNGFKPKAHFLTGPADEKAIKILSEAVGFETTLTTLYLKARSFHGGDLQKAIVAANLPLDDVLAIDRGLGWNRELVIQGLRFIHATGQSPTASLLQKARDRDLEDKLSVALGIEVKLSSLYLKAIEFFNGDFQAALEAAKLPVRAIVKKFSNKRWSRVAIHRGIRGLYNAGINPSATRLRDDRSEESEVILEEALGFPATLSALYNKAREFHEDNFQQALTEAGIPVRQVVSRLDTSHLTLEKIRGALRNLFENGFIPKATFLLHSRDPEATEVLSEYLGFPATLKTIFDHLRNRYGTTVQDLLESEALPTDKFRPWHKDEIWSRKVVRMALQELNAAGFTPYAPYLRKSENPLAQQILSKVVGYPMRLRALYIQAHKQFDGNFALALKDANLDPKEIIKRRIPALTENQIMGALRALFEGGYKPNTKTLLSGDLEVLRIISNHLKSLVTSSHLYNQARAHFGSLRSALLRAKLPADEIIERYSQKIDYLATLPTHVERVVEDGEVRYQTFIGSAPSTPDEILAKTELVALLEKEVPSPLRDLAEQVIDVILSCELGSIGPEDISEMLSTESDTPVTTQQVQQVFEILGRSSELRSFLMD